MNPDPIADPDPTATPSRPPTPFASLAEAAAHCRLSTKTIRRAVAAGELPRYRVRGRLRFRFADLDAFVTGRREGDRPGGE